ncbi:hypothetical protein PO903_06565 [Paenibacillus sp. PK4536]|uniref:hypothetical protein n=1 Tax=Paenibacillus sp. PK4536 TaxID=3024576 RepID=UPI002359ADE5|nr:hypothetical protein [Paenibacillus sp. PK4536]WIM40529.1 hypothetical protein PO903_06565 [Paenibacillus sp. PK4536]
MRILTAVCKGIWIIAITINVLSILWLVVGSTANFQSSMYIVARYTLFSVGIFSIILISLSIFYLWKTKKQSIGVSGCAVALVFSLFLLGCSSMNQEGVVDKEWFRDSVDQDPIKSTTDGKYDYRLEIINRGQKNVRQQLYVKELGVPIQSFKINTDEGSADSILSQ